MAPKTNPNDTFEYFKTAEIFITGKYKAYVDKLWTQGKIQASYFPRLVDLYATAAAIGLKTHRRGEVEVGNSDDKRTIQMMQLQDAYLTLSGLMKLVLMLDESRGLDEETRVRSAFKVPETREEHDAGMSLFHSYALGGIEYLYNHLFLRGTADDDDDYGEQRINNFIALIKNPLDVEELG